MTDRLILPAPDSIIVLLILSVTRRLLPCLPAYLPLRSGRIEIAPLQTLIAYFPNNIDMFAECETVNHPFWLMRNRYLRQYRLSWSDRDCTLLTTL